jgi:U6 snRNA-associated Sm-like protein LSm4
MYPSAILKSAVGATVSVEVENGDTYNGVLTNTDSMMNFTLSDVTCTRFWHMESLLIRGTSVKFLRFPEGVVPPRKAVGSG